MLKCRLKGLKVFTALALAMLCCQPLTAAQPSRGKWCTLGRYFGWGWSYRGYHSQSGPGLFGQEQFTTAAARITRLGRSAGNDYLTISERTGEHSGEHTSEYTSEHLKEHSSRHQYMQPNEARPHTPLVLWAPEPDPQSDLSPPLPHRSDRWSGPAVGSAVGRQFVTQPER
jgi:hypothetical protein